MKSLLVVLLFVCVKGISQSSIEFVKINPGSFVYGKFDPPYPKPDTAKKSYSKKDYKCAEKLAKRDAMPGFEVAISSPFSIGKYEVTQKQWKEVMNNNPSVFKGDDLPVDNITWDDANAFVEKLNASDPAHHYRLPTEFEWEYAARAGATDDISWDDIREQAQLGTKTTNKVGEKKPNAWGLYDMLGNVWEWTADIYNEKIFADRKPTLVGTQHVLKGASFAGDVKNATYMTHAAGPANGWDVGLRVVIEEKKTSPAPMGKIVPTKEDPAGWHISRSTHQGTTPTIKFKGNEIIIGQHPYGQGGVLLTNKKYRDFDLSLEVKIDSFCNSGIFLRSTESGQAYQIELAEPGGTGSLFGEMLRTSETAEATGKQKVWKPGDWNHFRIRMTGVNPHITLWLNGEQMWDITEPRNDFTAGGVEGYIGLQTHWTATYSAAAKAFDMTDSWQPGSKIRFRNVTIKEL
jgi:hypothetical protein